MANLFRKWKQEKRKIFESLFIYGNEKAYIKSDREKELVKLGEMN